MHAIIPVKINSTGCPSKNTRHIGGLPLFLQAVCYVRQEGCHAIVSTPDNAVAALCNEYHIPVFLEPNKEEVKEGEKPSQFTFLRNLMSRLIRPNLLALVQPTSPFRTPGLLSQLWRNIVEGKGRAYFTARQIKVQGRLSNGDLTYTVNSPRRQENKNWIWAYDGNLLVWHRSKFPKEGDDFLTDEWEPIVPDSHLTHIDIDTEADFELATNLAETDFVRPYLPTKKGLKIALISNCPLWMRDYSEEIDSSDLVVRINDMTSLDNGCTGKRTDLAFVLASRVYLANPAELQHGDVLRRCTRVTFCRKHIYDRGAYTRMKEVVTRHNLPNNWTFIEPGTEAASDRKTTLFEALWHLTREYIGAEITVYGDRHAATRAYEHSGNLGAAEDRAIKEIIEKYHVKWVEP